jgi:lipopolysaccharide/colanic/teichoic acid biosynthesis glycosyltransferase
MYRFRTTVTNAAKIGGPSTPHDDLRITWVGHFLRQSKLHELRHLPNLVNGTMSRVGPRPHVEWAVDLSFQ